MRLKRVAQRVEMGTLIYLSNLLNDKADFHWPRRRCLCVNMTLVPQLFSAPFASPSRNPSASPTVGGMSFVNGAPWNTQDAVAERTEAESP